MDNNTGNKRLFTAELQRLRQSGQQTAAAIASPGLAGQGPAQAEILRAIGELREDVRRVERILNPEAPIDIEVSAELAFLEQQRAEVNMLKTERRALAVCIEQTKHEIAALRPQQSEDDRLVAVTYELDAIVTSTERATQNILEGAEKIDALAGTIRAHLPVGESYCAQLSEEIGDNIVTIFEACNFQDITGQRITKVVNTLKYIEDRVNAMVNIWGAENFSHFPGAVADSHHDEDKALLNGPQLENKGISQDEIDKLFG